ncbi:MAG: FAD-binding oxidoreductase [Proteobacteria bacterium]|nr:FAD-binding oxidoreductase [Pseudomonadota bacterium]
MCLPSEIVADLAGLVGSAHVRDAADLAGRDPGVDPRNFGAGLLVRPADTGEVAAVLAYCNARRIGVVPQGGRTGLAGGAESRPGELVLSLERLDRIETLDPWSRTAVAGAGVTLAALATAAAAHGLSPGIDLGARASATLGGLVSTNAGGNGAFRHGTMRTRVLGLEAVLASGAVLDALGRVRKRNEGLAVEQLLIGAEGTLGVVTRVALELVAADRRAATALVAVEDAARAVELVRRVRAAGSLEALALEFLSGNHARAACRALGARELEPIAAAPYLVLVEVAGVDEAATAEALVELLATASAAGIVGEALVAQHEGQRQTMWRLREDWAIDRERPGGLWYDVSVPLDGLAGYLERCREQLATHDASLDVVVIGHLGDGNLHVTVNAERPISERYEEIAPIVADGLAALGGSFSAEHGIGLEKRATLARLGDPTRLALMRAIKGLLDPNGILNPGKVLTDALAGARGRRDG